MGWYVEAKWHNIAPGPNDPSIHPRIIVIHTMVGTMEGSEAHFRRSGLEAHFGVSTEGEVWQWRDTNYQADAQAGGNDYCISIETEDHGEPETRWTPAQERALVELIRYLMVQHTIPGVLVKSTSDRGIGYHRQFPEWNPNQHSCPGDTRLAQLTTEVIPQLQEIPDVTVQELVATLRAGFAKPWGSDTVAGAVAAERQAVLDTQAAVARLEQAVAQLQVGSVDLDALAAKVADLLAARLAS